MECNICSRLFKVVRFAVLKLFIMRLLSYVFYGIYSYKCYKFNGRNIETSNLNEKYK